MWCLTKEDLLFLGFSLKVTNPMTGEPKSNESGLHMNRLEFIAAIINMWILLKCVQTLPPCVAGYVIDLFSDNTSALLWQKVTAATRNPDLQPLARFASSLLIQVSRVLTGVQPCHIPGKENDEADVLSHFTNGLYKSWADVIKQCSRLKHCKICLLPPELLAVLADLSSCRPT